MKRRIRSSLRWRVVSAPSTLSSRWFRARETSPTSVPSRSGGARSASVTVPESRGIAATSEAMRATSSSGRIVRRTMNEPAMPVTRRAPRLASASVRSSRASVDCIGPRGRPLMTVSPPGAAEAATR